MAEVNKNNEAIEATDAPVKANMAAKIAMAAETAKVYKAAEAERAAQAEEAEKLAKAAKAAEVIRLADSSDASDDELSEGGFKSDWYIVHTYSGYENKVKADLDKTIENRGLSDVIREVVVPLQDVVEIKNGVRKASQKKMFPSYVLVNMVMNDDTWYVVRNTRGVTGFVGPGSKPVPLSEEEMRRIGVNKGEVVIDFEIGDSVLVVDGVWEGTVGAIKAINASKQTLTLSVDMFGRETPVELEFASVRKM